MKHKYLKNVVTLNLAPDKCAGCGKCADVCPHGVFVMENGRATLYDKNGCIECGACAKNCPASALSVKAGVGCAFAVIMGWITGGEPTCDCSPGGSASCC